jgi:uncharacterized protein (TIGR00251 family)
LSTVDWYRWDGADLLLSLKVQPKASRDGFGEPQQDRLRVLITAPPVDGQANAHLIGWLAKQFGVAKSAISVETGLASRLKRIRIRSPDRLPDLVAPPHH